MKTINMINPTYKKPKPPKPRPAPRGWSYYEIRLVSSRGTDQRWVYAFRKGTSHKRVKEVAEDVTAAIESYRVYITQVKIPAKPKLMATYKKACDRRDRAQNQYARLRAMTNPFNACSEDAEFFKRDHK